VIVGGGFAGLFAARELRHRPVEVTSWIGESASAGRKAWERVLSLRPSAAPLPDPV
jgi:2-polyprenyl-6-methoxyphenol hydroxylase-like FAD-dependent oxidoreductase